MQLEVSQKGNLLLQNHEVEFFSQEPDQQILFSLGIFVILEKMLRLRFFHCKPRGLIIPKVRFLTSGDTYCFSSKFAKFISIRSYNPHLLFAEKAFLLRYLNLRFSHWTPDVPKLLQKCTFSYFSSFFNTFILFKTDPLDFSITTITNNSLKVFPIKHS